MMPKVLLVDDEVRSLDAMRRTLDEDFTILTATDAAVAAQVASVLRAETLRAYESDDIVGVEVGGAVKNVLAIAAGASD